MKLNHIIMLLVGLPVLLVAVYLVVAGSKGVL